MGSGETWPRQGGRVVVGDGLVAPGARFQVRCGANAGSFRQPDRHDDLDATFVTLADALDAVVAWAEDVAAWATAPTRAEKVCGSAQLHAIEPGWDLGRLLAKAGTGAAEGLDALLEMLEVFCETAERRYGSEPTPPALSDGAGRAKGRA